MIYFISGFIIGLITGLILLINKLKKHKQYDKETEKKNLNLKIDNEKLKKENQSLKNEQFILSENIKNTDQLISKNQQLLDEACAQAQDIIVERTKIAEEKAKKVEQSFKDAEEDYKQEYLSVIEEFSIAFQENQKQLQNESNRLKDILLNLQQKVDAAVEANKREELIKNEKDFYRLVLSEQDIIEIKRLREVTPYLRNPEALNKVIWKSYYEKPYTDLIGRVLGSKPKTGIYKITNIQNGMCYVGQAVQVSDRWKQHIKRGIGAETPTRNKLYPAMLSIGVENFTFELIEECDKSLLNEREDFWQDYFKAKEFGYSIK